MVRLHPDEPTVVAASDAVPTEHFKIWIGPEERQDVRTMRSVVAERVGEPSEVLHLQNRPIPEPGPGQVRIRVAAVPVEASDLHTIRGRYGFTPEFPTVPGIESVGVIDELGGSKDGFTIGQRVSTIGVTGTWKENVVAHADEVHGGRGPGRTGSRDCRPPRGIQGDRLCQRSGGC